MHKNLSEYGSEYASEFESGHGFQHGFEFEVDMSQLGYETEFKYEVESGYEY